MKLLERLLNLAKHRNAQSILASVSFCEAIFFPVPPDLLLIPMGLALRQKVFRFAGICLLASVLGGISGYVIGSFFMETAGKSIIHFYQLESQFSTLQLWYQKYSVWVIALAGLTPLPYKLCSLSAGACSLNLPLFILVSVIGRGLRFFLIATLLYFYGEKARYFLEKRFNLLLTATLLLVVAGFFILQYTP